MSGLTAQRRFGHGISLRPGVTGAAALLSCGLLASSVSAAAAAKHGTSYAAEITNGHVGLIFSSDGRRMKRAFFDYLYRCSNSDLLRGGDAFEELAVSASGRFKSSYITDPEPSTSIPGATVSFRGSFKGRRTNSGAKVSGTGRFTAVISNTTTNTSVTCDTGPISFSAKD